MPDEKQHQDGIPHPKTLARPLSIGALSRATGIPAETLRTWERRYGNPRPKRKPSGHRLYPAAFVERLRRVARLLAQGHRPADVLNLPVSQLDSLLSLNEPAVGAPPERGATAFQEGEVRRFQETLLHASIRFDRGSLMRELRAAWGRMGPLRFLEEISGPFMTRVGHEWEEGRIEIRHEHFASACLSDFLREVREPFDREANGARVAAALLPGDTHEGGLLMVSVLLAVRGYRVIYLGADTPTEQVAATISSGGAEAVVISVSAAVPRARAEQEAHRLRESLPKRVRLWFGGAGAPEVPGMERFPTLTTFAAQLDRNP
ncbi:MAG TPA: MerR family transcriptional regulator [Candidatus Eisenbacteria bacterium]|nr:MerR family transcriptional regulator [Candidatus Eisenbacteria bacterium]